MSEGSKIIGGYDYQAFNSGSRTKRELAFFQPNLKTADADILPAKRLTEARVHNLKNNTPMISGAVQSKKDTIVGNHFKLNLTPIWKQISGDISEDQKRDWTECVETAFHAYADDPGCWIDAQRKKTFVDICRASIASDLFAGEFFLTREQRPSPLGYRTCFMYVEPERVMTPPRFTATQTIRGGIKLDNFGAPQKYYIRVYSPKQNEWRFRAVPIRNRANFQNIIHVFESDRANTTRGMTPFASTVEKIKSSTRYDDVELEAAIMAATYSIYVESDLGAASIFDALSGGEPSKEMTAYMTATKKYQEASMEAPLMSSGKQLTHLFPNEKIKMLSANHPNNGFPEFEKAMHRHISRAIGMSYEEYSGNYSDTTYNSARASMLASWRFTQSKRQNFPSKVATFMFQSWLDEAIVTGKITAPIDYFPNRSALTRCSWIGAGRQDIDELKSARANDLKLKNGTTTEIELASNEGKDYRDIFVQREKVIDMKVEAMRNRGVNVNDELISKFYLGEETGIV